MTTYKIQKIAFGIPMLLIYDLKNISIPSSFNNATSPSLNLLPPASTMIQTWLPSSCSRLSSPFNQLNMLVKSLDYSLFVPNSDIHKINKKMNLPKFDRYGQIIFCLYMYSLNFKLWRFCIRTLFRSFMLVSVWVFCVGVWFHLETLYGLSVWLLCKESIT